MKDRNRSVRRVHKKRQKTKKNSTGKKFPLWQFLVLLICIPTFFFSTFFFSYEMFRYRTENHAYAELSQNLRQIRNQSGQSVSTSGKFTEYAALWEQNHDFAGWLYIEDTRIDYPVMQTPDDPEYYLHRAFDGSNSQSGCLFADAAYSLDGNSLLVYGHHMKDNSMFGSLTDYQSQEFARKHSVIHFDTLTEERDYELLAAFYWDAASEQENAPFYYYQYPDLSSPELFDEYIGQVKAHAIYDTGVSASYGDNILTLSTCSYHTSNSRFVVVAVSH